MNIEIFLLLAKNTKREGGYHLVSPPVLALYVLPQTQGEETLAVQVHGVTDNNYKVNLGNKNKVEISFPGKPRRYFVKPKLLRYPVPS